MFPDEDGNAIQRCIDARISGFSADPQAAGSAEGNLSVGASVLRWSLFGQQSRSIDGAATLETTYREVASYLPTGQSLL